MNKPFDQFVLCFLVAGLFTTAARADAVTASGAKLKLLSKDYSFTEGPIADAYGDVYFTDQPNDRIVKYSFAEASFVDWMKPAGRSNGLYYVAPHQLIACADADNELWSIHLADKSHKVIGRGTSHRLNGPNDCWVHSDGSIFFTDPLYKRDYWKHEPAEDNPRAVYRLSPQGDLTVAANDFKQPNGIIGDAERNMLYVADLGGKKTYRYRIGQDGKLSGRAVHCEAGSDGMTIDVSRNIYLTGSEGVTVYNPDGKLIETIAVPRGWTANVTFAGPKRDHLFITSGNAVFLIKMAVTGFPPRQK